MKNEIFCFYKKKFQEPFKTRSLFINPAFKTISVAQVVSLEAHITEEEIKNAIWECGGDQAPRPDGFTFEFIKVLWEELKGDILKFVQFFEAFGTLDKGCTSSFVTLVPKVKDPINLSDYRPISLIRCLYKIIAKILAIRLKMVIGDIVGEEQTAYVEGRNILDGPLIINEVCSWVKSNKKNYYCSK